MSSYLLFYILRIDTLVVLVSIVCLFLEVDSRLAFLALVRPIKLLRYCMYSMQNGRK